MPGKWHRETFQARKYEPLTDYVVTTSVSEAEAVEVKKQLVTPLHGFLGQAYNYDDHDLTEEWMLTFRDTQSTGPSDDDVIRTQIESLMEIMKVQVQDRVCTESGVLDTIPLSMQNALKEVPVWGIDSYTRRMVELAIEDRLPVDTYTKKKIAEFIEKALLPSINEQPPAEAYNMTHAVTAILNVKNLCLLSNT